MRLDKFLSECKVLTRSECASAVRSGRIFIDGKVATKKDENVTEHSTVLLDGKKVEYNPFVYLMLNKPQGYVSATDDKNQKTVLDLVDEKYLKFDLFPVGRLDKDTTGLVILTNDGEMAHRVLSPKNNHTKTYYFECADILSEENKSAIENGISLKDGYTCKPCSIRSLTSTTGEIVLTEGKYHQIKRMFGAVGNKITSLKRIEFAGLKLVNLSEGEYRPLTQNEIKILKSY